MNISYNNSYFTYSLYLVHLINQVSMTLTFGPVKTPVACSDFGKNNNLAISELRLLQIVIIEWNEPSLHPKN